MGHDFEDNQCTRCRKTVCQQDGHEWVTMEWGDFENDEILINNEEIKKDEKILKNYMLAKYERRVVGGRKSQIRIRLL